MVVKGKKVTLKERWQMLRRELKGMDRREKLEHLWEYYKWVLGLFLGFVLLVAVVISSIISLNTETILAGGIINVPVDPDGYVLLQDGYYQRAKTGGRQMVELTNMTFVDPYTTTEQTFGMDIHEDVVAMISADLMDYVMFDDVALPYFMDPDMFADLRELFTDAQLEEMGSAVIWLEIPEREQTIPVAINIRDTAFYQNHMELDKNIYIAFSIRLPRKEATLDFWQFIKGGQTESLTTEFAGTAVDVKVNATGREMLTHRIFSLQGYTLGDQRVEFNEQSFLPPSDPNQEDISQKVVEYINASLKNGQLDYVLCDAAALEKLQPEALRDPTQVLSEEVRGGIGPVLAADGVTPIALPLNQTVLAENGLAVYETVYLVFGAGSDRQEICQSLWQALTTPMPVETTE